MTVPQPDPTPSRPRGTLTDLHSRILDDVSRSDAARAAAGETRWIRALVDHELCPPGPTCLVVPNATLVVVAVLDDGIRFRWPLVVPAVAT